MKAELGVYPHERQLLYEKVPLETPLAVDIHTTHFCNFRCNYCLLSKSKDELKKAVLGRDGYKEEMMSWETFSEVVRQLKEFPEKIKMITTGGLGESTTHPRIVDMVQLLRDSNVTEKIQMISNAMLLTPEFSEKIIDAGLGELRISLQGISSEKYWEISKAKIDWDTLYGNIKYFAKIKGDCKLKVKVADTALEKGDEERFFELFGDICDAVGVEHIFETWKVHDLTIGNETVPTEKTRFGRDYRYISVCRRPFTSIDILPDGQLTQWCHIWFGHEKNIWEQPIRQQWNSREQNILRRNMLLGKREEYPHCKRCTFITNTWHPEDILDGHEDEILRRMDEVEKNL